MIFTLSFEGIIYILFWWIQIVLSKSESEFNAAII